MDTYKIKDFVGGWYIGNFEPSILKTDQVEVGIKFHTKGEYIHPHYQRVATEHNLIVSGKMTANGKELSDGDIFVYHPYEVCEVEFHTDVTVICVKTPSLGIDDKVDT
jgi:hypothetical protein